jgi:hypothetical protein
MGSGETAPSLVKVHREIDLATPGDGPAVLLDTTFGFQVNADDLVEKTAGYFSASVGLPVELASWRRAEAPEVERERTLALVGRARWAFAGPGSPTYTLRQWRGTPMPAALADVPARGGTLVFGSAAACTLGTHAIPVYEVYKAGADPYWDEGLDLLGTLTGLHAVVIPHYDNAEGGNYDTRYCYLGERRLSLLEAELPADAAVLGVDEHTAAIFDLRAGSLEVRGRGCITVRRAGASTVLTPGAAVPLARLRELVRRAPRSAGRRRAALPGGRATAAAPPGGPAAAAVAEPPAVLADVVRAAERRFDRAAGARQASGMVEAILELEAAIHAWAADTEEDQGTEQARAVLRGLIGRLGRAAQEGLHDPRARLRPAVESLLTLRAALRAQGNYPAADAIRDALTAAELHLSDTADGPRWSPDAPPDQ